MLLTHKKSNEHFMLYKVPKNILFDTYFAGFHFVLITKCSICFSNDIKGYSFINHHFHLIIIRARTPALKVDLYEYIENE